MWGGSRFFPLNILLTSSVEEASESLGIEDHVTNSALSNMRSWGSTLNPLTTTSVPGGQWFLNCVCLTTLSYKPVSTCIPALPGLKWGAELFRGKKIKKLSHAMGAYAFRGSPPLFQFHHTQVGYHGSTPAGPQFQFCIPFFYRAWPEYRLPRQTSVEK